MIRSILKAGRSEEIGMRTFQMAAASVAALGILAIMAGTNELASWYA
jgi:hypothetical protein